MVVPKLPSGVRDINADVTDPFFEQTHMEHQRIIGFDVEGIQLLK